jgi:hypothetical protein
MFYALTISCFSEWIGLRLDQESKAAFDSEIMFNRFRMWRAKRDMLFYIMILSCPEPIEGI